METTQQELTAEERHERLVAFLKRHMNEKRRFEEQMVEEAQLRKKARQQAEEVAQH